MYGGTEITENWENLTKDLPKTVPFKNEIGETIGSAVLTERDDGIYVEYILDSNTEAGKKALDIVKGNYEHYSIPEAEPNLVQRALAHMFPKYIKGE